MYVAVFQGEFNAHDALEDLHALHHVLFQSPLWLTIADIVNNSNMKSTSFAFEDMEFLDGHHKYMQAFKNKLFSQGDNGLVKQNTIQKIAESSPCYDDLQWGKGSIDRHS